MTKKMLKKFFAFCLLAVLVVGTVSCDDKTPTPTPEPEPEPTPEVVTISLTSDKTEIAKATDKQAAIDATLSVTITGTENKEYTTSVSDTSLVSVTGNVLSVIGDTTIDKMVSVTVTSKADTTKTASKSFKVVAPVVEGQVGELTSDMIKEIGNASIQVSGSIVDVYRDIKNSDNSTQHTYLFNVDMSDGAWSGTWYSEGQEQNAVTNTYIRGEKDGVQDESGNVGHALQEQYIDKNNQVTTKDVKNYLSIPTVWESQHYWNHLGSLNVNKFTYDAENKVYEYSITDGDTDTAYLMTYLAYSLTPMLEDSLVKFFFQVENGKIVGALAQTETLLYGEDTSEDPDAMSYTTVTLKFDNVGTTKVEAPAAYEAPEHGDLLAKAITTMQNAESYTFKTTDVTTYAPSSDDSDYSTDSATSTSQKAKKVSNVSSSVGTVGCVGRITKDAVLFANTGKYSYTLDGNSYHTEYSGYKQNSDNSVDYFEYDGTQKTLVGKKKYLETTIKDVVPQFDFSANIFKFEGSSSKNGKTNYTFTLKSTSATRDIAMQISSYPYADDACASVQTTLTIVVDSDGNLVSTLYPYSISSGTYMGYCSTVFENINSTTLDDDVFDGYVQRQLKTTWSEYTMISYSTTFSTKDSHDENAQVAIDAIYGEAAKYLPSPDVIMNIVGDNIYGPFYNWKTVATDTDGNEIKHGFFSINATSQNYDENNQITDFEELMDEFKTALGACGFTLSVQNTDTTSPRNRYVTFINEGITIVINNIGTRYLYIDFYLTGDWTLKR